MEICSSCIYCGVGCRLKYIADGDTLKTLGDQTDPISLGKPCLKGLTIGEIFNKNRLGKPQIKINGKLKEVSWKEALKFIFENTKDLAPQEVFFSGSGRITNEDNFVIQKFARKVFSTNNIDACCARLCHQPTIQAMNDCFGTPNLSLIENLFKIDTLFIIGSNPASNYPVFWHKVLAEKQKRNLKIILVGSMISLTAKTLKRDDLVSVIEQGSELVFLNGIINYLLKKSIPQKIKNLEGFEKLKTKTARFTPEFVAGICKIKKEDFLKIGESISLSSSLGVFHGMGLTQHINGIENVHTLLNLVILKNALLLTLRGEINVQGAGDMNLNPLPKPGGPFEKGKNMIESFYLSPVKAAFISNFNPAQSLPDLKRLWGNLEKMFLVLINPYFNKTCEYAKVILPSPILIERTGTITNGERRVRLVRRVLPPYKESKPEWQIYQNLAKFWGKEEDFNYQNEEEIFKEIVNNISDYHCLSPREIYGGKDGWPQKTEKFRRFFPEDWEGYDDPRSEKYPFILTTFRQPDSFLTSKETEKSEVFYLCPDDALKLKIKNGEKIEVESIVSSLSGAVKIDPSIPKGTVAASFHSKKFLINTLFPLEFDEETFTPNFKATAVRIKKI